MPSILKALAEDNNKGNSKTLLNLAIESQERGPSDLPPTSEFVDIVVSQMKSFMFGGHETTAQTLCFIYHLVNSNPTKLEALRREHDEVLGDPAMTADLIKDNPALLNQLPYTAAVIRETLRLFPPVGIVRSGSRDFFLTDPTTGERYPTNGMMVFGCSAAAHRNEAYWPEPHKFIPERWLVPEGDALHPQIYAWRPFEFGPRNCIGQELAHIELRAFLALTVRDFDIESQFPADGPRLFGDVAYQVNMPGQVTARPRDDMPVKVSLRRHQEKSS